MNNPQPNQPIKAVEVKLDSQEWYQLLIEECEAIMVETEFCARTEIIKGKWQLGNAILENKLNFQKAGYGERIIESVAKDIGLNPREIWRCVQFREKYPQLCLSETEFDINQLPEGKNISWRKLINKYLPEPKEKEKGKCSHSESEEISFLKCKKCGEHLEGYTMFTSKEKLIKDLTCWAKSNNFPSFRVNEEKASVPLILSKEKEWEGYLKNDYRTISELWKIWKRIENGKV